MTPLRVRSYASDALHAASNAPEWTLFVRQQQPASGGGGSVFVLTALVPTSDSVCAVYEKLLDRDAMDQHIEDLGIEVQATAFSDLLLKTLTNRKSVDVTLDGEDESPVRVVLTYKFSETISRKGQVVLACVSAAVPLAVATLLQDVHVVQNESVLTASQQLQRQNAVASLQSKAAAALLPVSRSLSQDSSQSADGDAAVTPTSTATNSAAATLPANAQLLKRRHVPTGTVRRKGPRGAKLAKHE